MLLSAENKMEYGATLLRVSLGVMWIAHAMLKWNVYSIDGFAQWLDGQGLPGIMAWPVFLMEVIGGMMIILGLYARYVTCALLPILCVALYVHIPNGWSHTNQGGGWEYPLFLISASITHIFIGDGKFLIRPRVIDSLAK